VTRLGLSWPAVRLPVFTMYRGDESAGANGSVGQEESSLSEWTLRHLQPHNRSSTKTEYDAASVAKQARWAKESLINHLSMPKAPKNFDKESIAAQARSAKHQLHSLQDSTQRTVFDAEGVAKQSRSAKALLSSQNDRVERGRDVSSALAGPERVSSSEFPPSPRTPETLEKTAFHSLRHQREENEMLVAKVEDFSSRLQLVSPLLFESCSMHSPLQPFCVRADLFYSHPGSARRCGKIP
jgi:hypothetical protein